MEQSNVKSILNHTENKNNSIDNSYQLLKENNSELDVTPKILTLYNKEATDILLSQERITSHASGNIVLEPNQFSILQNNISSFSIKDVSVSKDVQHLEVIGNPIIPDDFFENSEATQDIIHNTCISKCWVIQVLMKLLEEVKLQADVSVGGQALLLDIGEELQDELCRLWDMTSNPEVAKYIHKCCAVNVLTDVIAMSRAPRLTEISIGILGDMSSVPEICEEISLNAHLIQCVQTLLSNVEFDIPTLIETMRLVCVQLGGNVTDNLWSDTIGGSEDILKFIKFVFRSCMNSTLLLRTGQVVDALFERREEICVAWASADFVESTLEAFRQLMTMRCVDTQLESFLRIFQILSVSQIGISAIVENADPLADELLRCMNAMCDDVDGVGDHVGSLNCILSVIGALSETVDVVRSRILADTSCLESMLKILKMIYETNHDTVHAWLSDIHHHHWPPSTATQHPDSSARCKKMPLGIPVSVHGMTSHTGETSSETENGNGAPSATSHLVMCILLQQVQRICRLMFSCCRLDAGKSSHGNGREAAADDQAANGGSGPVFLLLLRSMDKAPSEMIYYLVVTLLLKFPESWNHYTAVENAGSVSSGVLAGPDSCERVDERGGSVPSGVLAGPDSCERVDERGGSVTTDCILTARTVPQPDSSCVQTAAGSNDSQKEMVIISDQRQLQTVSDYGHDEAVNEAAIESNRHSKEEVGTDRCSGLSESTVLRQNNVHTKYGYSREVQAGVDTACRETDICHDTTDKWTGETVTSMCMDTSTLLKDSGYTVVQHLQDVCETFSLSRVIANMSEAIMEIEKCRKGFSSAFQTDQDQL